MATNISGGTCGTLNRYTVAVIVGVQRTVGGRQHHGRDEGVHFDLTASMTWKDGPSYNLSIYEDKRKEYACTGNHYYSSGIWVVLMELIERASSCTESTTRNRC